MEAEDEKLKLKKEIATTLDEDERRQLLMKLDGIDKNMNRELEEEKRYQDSLLEARKQRKADRMALRKMRIELE
jgi:hypothetical protein